MLAILIALPARAADVPNRLTVVSLPEWWAAPGGPGFVDDAHMGNGLPFGWLGLVAGGVTVRDDLQPGYRPWPGVDEIHAPLAWYDSASVVVGEDGGWRGFSAALVELRALAEPPRGGKPRAAFTFVSGSSAVDRTGLLVQRSDEGSWLRAGALTEEREGTGLLGRRGQHLWLLDLGWRRRAHTLSGAYSQAGAAGGTRRDVESVDLFGGARPPYPGLEEAARGESGELSWTWERAGRRLAAALRRSRDHRESFETPVTDAFALFAEREAQQNSLEIEAAAGPPGHGRGLRLELARAEVRRSDDFLSGRAARGIRQRTAWLAARAERPLAGGALELQLGAGHASAAARSRERVQLAPSVTWRVGRDSRRLRLYAERLVTPVWSDLAPGVLPFTQDVWLAGFHAGAGDPARTWIELGGLAAEVGARALLQRWPVRDVSLRYGWTPDAVRVRDAMVTLAGGARRGPFSADASGFSRVRPIGAQSAQVDPAAGARAGVEAGFRTFAGDLGVRARLDAAWVGARESESLPEYFVRPRPLAGYVTYGGSLRLSVGDADIVLRATNLGNEQRPQVWSDPSRPFPGTPAVGSGRQFRVELAWPFFN